MQVVVQSDQTVHLGDPDNFREFKLLAHTGANEMGQISTALHAAAAGEADNAHSWISARWLRAQKNDPAWQDSLSNMLSFARSKGWMNDAGAIRAHVEWL